MTLFPERAKKMMGSSEVSILALVLILIAVGCEGPRLSRANLRPGSHRVLIESSKLELSGFPSVPGKKVEVWCELAADPIRRQNGLMHRTSMPEDMGMLFIFPAPAEQGFWMKNCKMSLDIAYIGDDGRIIDILKMDAPTVGQVSFPRYRSSQAVRYALETNVGWFARQGIVVGDQVEGFRGPPGLQPR